MVYLIEDGSDGISGYFKLRVTYRNLNTEQVIESLEYDLVNLLSDAGGNLGLFLGLSCLSVLLAALKCMKRAPKRFDENKSCLKVRSALVIKM
jgi:hypothetical protein